MSHFRAAFRYVSRTQRGRSVAYAVLLPPLLAAVAAVVSVRSTPAFMSREPERLFLQFQASILFAWTAAILPVQALLLALLASQRDATDAHWIRLFTLAVPRRTWAWAKAVWMWGALAIASAVLVVAALLAIYFLAPEVGALWSVERVLAFAWSATRASVLVLSLSGILFGTCLAARGVVAPLVLLVLLFGSSWSVQRNSQEWHPWTQAHRAVDVLRIDGPVSWTEYLSSLGWALLLGSAAVSIGAAILHRRLGVEA